jgi:uncharacterized membrane protein YfcA
MHSLQLALAALGIILAGFVKGVSGLGFPTIGVPIAALFLDPQTTVVVITIPAFFMNVIQAVQGRVSLTLVRRFVPIFVFLVPGAVGGTALLARVPAHLLVAVLGVIVTVYAATALWRLHLVIPLAHERWIGAVTGLCAGMIGGATSIFAPPLAIYLTALQLSKQAFIAIISVCLLVGQVPHLISLVGFRLLTVPRLQVAALFCILSTLGFLLGVHLQRRISQPLFTKVVLATLLVVGLSLLRTGVLGWR